MRYLDAAENAVHIFYPAMLRQAEAYSTLCTALDEMLEPTKMVVLRGPRDALHTWHRTLARRYLPDAMTFAIESTHSDLTGMFDKPAGNTVNAYLCRGVTCLPPIADVETLTANLEARSAV
jgi:uncharacterized protein YyaL (SSP411 family)